MEKQEIATKIKTNVDELNQLIREAKALNLEVFVHHSLSAIIDDPQQNLNVNNPRAVHVSISEKIAY